MENALKISMPRMVLLVVPRATSAPWLTLALLEFVLREPSWNQEPAAAMLTDHLVTRLIFVMEAEPVFPIGNLQELLATLDMKWQSVWSTNALLMADALKIHLL